MAVEETFDSRCRLDSNILVDLANKTMYPSPLPEDLFSDAIPGIFGDNYRDDEGNISIDKLVKEPEEFFIVESYLKHLFMKGNRNIHLINYVLEKGAATYRIIVSGF